MKIEQLSKLQLGELHNKFAGEISTDSVTRKAYSTDASVYQEVPLAVAFPKNEDDIRLLIELANEAGVGLIPRTAGTSLAGQVVGSGIVVDVSRHMTEIIEINSAEKWVRVQPGVIRNELNMALRPHHLMFGPETSTANRAMIGGMLGNNSCGSNSIVYGTTRDKIIEVHGFFSNGRQGTLGNVSPEQLKQLCQGDLIENQIYAGLNELLSNQENRAEIQKEFPKLAVTRRNTGYAIDCIANTKPFGAFERPFNLGQLIAGSEGTLFFATEIKLRCDGLPPKYSGVLCAHFQTIDEALRANIHAMKFQPFASELIDQLVLQGASRNIEQSKNMTFVKDDPAAILIVELRDETEQSVKQQLDALKSKLVQEELGYDYPIMLGPDSKPVWELRKAGLGVVANVPGDSKPTTVIEDTAVAIEDLPEYISELNELLQNKYGFACVHYGHAGSGELHLRPVLNLKTEKGRTAFQTLAADVAILVKKYGGSLSGEHGDGRLRGGFLQQMIGVRNYELIKKVKRLFDPNNIFNPGKIVDTSPMTESLRYSSSPNNTFDTVFAYEQTKSMLGAAEMCSGSGDCRKTELTGGTMCPSYMATRDERDTTRARANMLRHALTDPDQLNPLASDEVNQVMDLCLSCKGCKSECPSNVDIAKLKAEFTNGYQKANGVSMRTKLFAGIDRINQINSHFPSVANFLMNGKLTSGWMKKLIGVHPKRKFPDLYRTTLRRWFKKHQPRSSVNGEKGSVLLFCDEFTNYHDVQIGIDTIELLEELGYQVQLPKHLESGRAAISKGRLDYARQVAIKNVELLSEHVSNNQPLIGLEPSAILTFRDEYLDLVPSSMRDTAVELSGHVLMLDEFISREIAKGNLSSDQFKGQARIIRLHGHCHQKALASLKPTVQALQLPKNYRVKLIPSGCCGMAGSFGYEHDHYEISMKIGELVLFPAIRNEPAESIIAAPGTSCRHQIFDGTGRTALHPGSILRQALKETL